jgi:hypothetical protein
MKCALTAWAGKVAPSTSSSGANMRNTNDRFMSFPNLRIEGMTGLLGLVRIVGRAAVDYRPGAEE